MSKFDYRQLFEPYLPGNVRSLFLQCIVQSGQLKQLLKTSPTVSPEMIGKPTVSIGGGIASTLLLPLYLTSLAHPNRFNFVYCAVENDEKDLLSAVEQALRIPIRRIDPSGSAREQGYEGFNIWSVFIATRYMGNWSADPCSRILKREAMAKFLSAHQIKTLYLGIGIDELDRTIAITGNYSRQGVTPKMPLTSPSVWKWFNRRFGTTDSNAICQQVLGFIPESYQKRLPHHNCGDFCIKAGKTQTERSYWYNRERFIEHAHMERLFNKYIYPDGQYTVFREQKTIRGRNTSHPVAMFDYLAQFDTKWAGQMFPTFAELSETGCVWCAA